MAKSGKSKLKADIVNNKKDDQQAKEKEDDDDLEEMENGETNENDSVCVAASKVSTPISILIESLVKNLCSVYEPDSQKASMIYEFICDKLCKMNMIDESYHMNEFEGMRSHYQRAFLHLLKKAVGGEQMQIRPVWPNVDESNSHYRREFDEMDYIAGGGFGRVYRVKHKLDGTEYAIKKIPIRAEGIESVRNYLSEVKTFASMNHSNIVQYKAAWLELGSPATDTAIPDSESESTCEQTCHTKPNIKEHIDDEYIYHRDVDESFSDRKNDSSDFEVNFEHSCSIHSVNNKHFSYSNNNLCSGEFKRNKRTKRNSVSEGGLAICTLDFREIQHLQTQQRAHPKWATLYIQMALCQSTLKQWLEKRNDAEIPTTPTQNALVPLKNQARDDTIYEILKQLLRGVEYIHSKGVVHHDIKPSNIFIQLDNGNLVVQLGDFGLACPLQSVRHSLALGTKLYAAPEQLAGKCDPKSDMFSLGIVLYELVETFRTDMERVQHITELRKGHLPSHIFIQQPQLAQIITQLVSKHCADRPNACVLLKTLARTPTESQEIQELRCKIAERDEEIARLKELLKSAQIKSI